MKPYLLLLLVMIAGQSYAAGDCKFKYSDGTDADSSKYTYTGECKNGYADGKGVYTWSNSSRYEGDFKNGLQDGKGVYTWSNGDRYEGDFKNNLMDGKGVYTWSNGWRYEGDWKQDNRAGFGLEYTSSGKLDTQGFYVGDKLLKECTRAECDPDYDAYEGLDQKTKMDIVMSKITNALKEERYKDAIPYFSFLEKRNSNLPESFYFYEIQSLSKIDGFPNSTKTKAKEYLKKYGSKGKYYAEVVEIMGR